MNCIRQAVSLILLTVASGAFADSDVKALQANYAAISAAFKRKDINGIAKFVDPAFVAHLDHGITMNKEKVIADYKTQMMMVKDVTWVRNIRQAVRKGATVTATVDGQVSGLVTGPDSKPHKFTLMASSIDSWSNHGKTWTLITTKVLKHDMFLDGHLMKPPVAR